MAKAAINGQQKHKEKALDAAGKRRTAKPPMPKQKRATTRSTKRDKKRPRGRPAVLTEPKRKEILAILAYGGSRNDAADYVGCAKSTLSQTIARDAAFYEQIKRAEAGGKVRHLKHVAEADAWQASAWFLERKYPEEFGRRRVEVSGPGGGPIESADRSATAANASRILAEMTDEERDRLRKELISKRE